MKKLQLFSPVLVSRIGTWLGRFTHTFLRFLNFSFFGCLVRIKKGWEGRGGSHVWDAISVISLLFLLYFVTYDIDFSALIQLLHAMVVYW